MEGAKSITIIFLLFVSLLTSATSNPAFAQNRVHIVTDDNFVFVRAGDRILLRYPYRAVPFKPYVQQLFSPGGVNVLRDAPADHLHHHALMFAVAVDGVNFWEEGQAAGRQVHRTVADVRVEKSDDVTRASFTEHLDWLNPGSGKLLLKEHRTLAVRRMKGMSVTLLTWQSRLEVPAGKKSATLTGANYHGLGMRFVKSMDTGGRFRNADGKTGVDGTNNMRAAWCAYTAAANGKPVTVAMFDHPDNQRHPATWFTMAKPFAYLSATMKLHKEPLKVMSGKPLVLRYAVAIWDGRVETEQINQLYKRWIARKR